jgi:hypothetical protein
MREVIVILFLVMMIVLFMGGIATQNVPLIMGGGLGAGAVAGQAWIVRDTDEN